MMRANERRIAALEARLNPTAPQLILLLGPDDNRTDLLANAKAVNPKWGHLNEDDVFWIRLEGVKPGDPTCR